MGFSASPANTTIEPSTGGPYHLNERSEHRPEGGKSLEKNDWCHFYQMSEEFNMYKIVHRRNGRNGRGGQMGVAVNCGKLFTKGWRFYLAWMDKIIC